MQDNQFNWTRTKQLSPLHVLLAFALPSAFAYIGFHTVLPILVDSGTPVMVAWPVIASAMLALLVVIAVGVMNREAKLLNVSLVARMCFRPLSKKQWLIYIAIMILGLAVASGASQLVLPFMTVTGLEVPSYMPFFLNPDIDPMTAPAEVVSPRLVLKGQVFLIPLFAVTLLLNILAEELYFRAWLLPKMSRYGQVGWIINAVLFAAYHSFQLWMLPTILVGSLIWAFVIYRSKSIYPALVGHLVGNFLLTILGIGYLILS